MLTEAIKFKKLLTIRLTAMKTMFIICLVYGTRHELSYSLEKTRTPPFGLLSEKHISHKLKAYAATGTAYSRTTIS